MDTARLRISTRLILGFTLMMSLLAALGAATLVNVGAIDDAFELALNERYPKIKRFFVIKDGNATVARALRDLFIVTDPAQVQSLRATIAEVTRRTQVELEALQRQISPAGKAGFDKLLEARAAYSAPRDRILELLKNGDKAEAARVLVTEVSPRQADYMKAIDGMVFVGDKLLESAHREASEQVRTGRIVVVSVVGLAFFVAVGTSVWLIRSITRPVGEAVRIARRVADGDLTTTFEVRGPAETAELLASLKEMQRRLAAIVGDVRHGADGVATASGEIASGNDDLSTRTESQASALQQTSSSMEQLSSTVRANADSAEQANQLALAASAVATRGGAAVQEVVTTMRGISHSSGRIAEIIGTIDGIAFQTNILALNAAVEAARAGEQGRGFAVVASEVRTLAQRSAAAAKEIKGLISQSTERVQTGTEQVDQAGATIEEVVRSIRRVTEIVGEISAASREQHAGVDQVGRAVVEMDRSTQQNAALVEQSAAAAQSLKQQAQQLLRAVAVFKTRPEAASV